MDLSETPSIKKLAYFETVLGTFEGANSAQITCFQPLIRVTGTYRAFVWIASRPSREAYEHAGMSHTIARDVQSTLR